MPRAGAGGGGGHVSSGGHSSGRISGGHRVGGSRAGSGMGSGMGNGMRGGFGGGFGRGPRFYGPRRTVYVNTGNNGNGGNGGSGGGLFAIVVLAIFLIIMCIVFVIGSGSKTKSTIERKKLDTGNAYINDCIVDEIGWFDNVGKTEKKLKEFWEKTGVQPYIVLHAYDEELTSDSEKQEWAEQYYQEHFTVENIFLYVYFAEQNTDDSVGYMAYVNGKQTSSVMDSEAVEIFWNTLDKYWVTRMSTDDVFTNTFHDTAKTIMRVSTTGKDVMKWLLIVVAIALVVCAIIWLVKTKNQRAREKAQEDERILNTPLEDIVDAKADDLTSKYLNEDQK